MTSTRSVHRLTNMRKMMVLVLMVVVGGCGAMDPDPLPLDVDMGKRLLPEPIRCEATENTVPCRLSERCCFCCTDSRGRVVCNLFYDC